MLERKDLITFADQALESFLTHPPQNACDYTLRITSGTTGGSPLYNIRDHGVSATRALSSWHWGAERVLICYGANAARFTNSVAQHADPKEEKQALSLDAQDLTTDLTMLIADFRPQRIIGISSFIARAAGFFDERAGSEVRALKCTGEPVTEPLMKIFSRVFPRASISSIYWTIELNQISKETCGYRELNYYHPFDSVRIEIENPDQNGVGDILISAPFYGTIRAEKYRVGDIGRLHPGICPCGEAVTFEVMGRRGFDYIKLCGALLVQVEFDRVAQLFPQIIRDYRVEASVVTSDGRVKGNIMLYLQCPSLVPTKRLESEVAAQFAANLFLTPTETLADLVRKDFFNPLVIRWSDQPFPQKDKLIKLRNV